MAPQSSLFLYESSVSDTGDPVILIRWIELSNVAFLATIFVALFLCACCRGTKEKKEDYVEPPEQQQPVEKKVEESSVIVPGVDTMLSTGSNILPLIKSPMGTKPSERLASAPDLKLMSGRTGQSFAQAGANVNASKTGAPNLASLHLMSSPGSVVQEQRSAAAPHPGKAVPNATGGSPATKLETTGQTSSTTIKAPKPDTGSSKHSLLLKAPKK